jgi:CRP-like cAMP-binding protein
MMAAYYPTPVAAMTWLTPFSPRLKERFPSLQDFDLTKGATLFRQGDTADSLFLLNRGMVRLSHLLENGAEFTFGLRGSGSLLGVAPAIVNMPHDDNAVTLTKAQVSVIAAGEFRSAVKNDVNVAWQLQRIQACDLIDQAREMSVRHCARARSRILCILQRVTSEQPNSGSVVNIQLPFSYRDLAKLTGVSPEHLSRVLRELEHDGIIKRSRNTFAIRRSDS